jgi:hypothetical protein
MFTLTLLYNQLSLLHYLVGPESTQTRDHCVRFRQIPHPLRLVEDIRSLPSNSGIVDPLEAWIESKRGACPADGRHSHSLRESGFHDLLACSVIEQEGAAQQRTIDDGDRSKTDQRNRFLQTPLSSYFRLKLYDSYSRNLTFIKVGCIHRGKVLHADNNCNLLSSS